VSRIDAVDRQILTELVGDARVSMRDLAARVHVSRANAYARVRRLIDDGVIERFTAQVAPEEVGLGTTAYVSMRIQQNSWRAVADHLSGVPGVEHIALCSGDFDVVALVRTRDTSHLRDLVLEDIRAVPGVVTTRTVVVLDEVRPVFGVGGAATAMANGAEPAPGS
jgi:DNA-binding Lrp family transcriptional regulator